METVTHIISIQIQQEKESINDQENHLLLHLLLRVVRLLTSVLGLSILTSIVTTLRLSAVRHLRLLRRVVTLFKSRNERLMSINTKGRIETRARKENSLLVVVEGIEVLLPLRSSPRTRDE